MQRHDYTLCCFELQPTRLKMPVNEALFNQGTMLFS